MLARRFTFNHVEVKALEIAARSATGLEVSDADKQWLASHAMALSSAWASLKATRDAFTEEGMYKPL